MRSDLFLSSSPKFAPEIFFCLLACFPPECSWQQQEQAQAEGAFVARDRTQNDQDAELQKHSAA